MPGVYDIVYEHLTGASIMPSNPRATLARRWDVEDSPLRDIDIPVGRFRGSFLLNGASFSFSLIRKRGDLRRARHGRGRSDSARLDASTAPSTACCSRARIAPPTPTSPEMQCRGTPSRRSARARRVRQGVETTAVLDVRGWASRSVVSAQRRRSCLWEACRTPASTSCAVATISGCTTPCSALSRSSAMAGPASTSSISIAADRTCRRTPSCGSGAGA